MQHNRANPFTKEDMDKAVEGITSYISDLAESYSRVYYEMPLSNRTLFNIMFAGARLINFMDINQNEKKSKENFTKGITAILEHPDFFTNRHRENIKQELQNNNADFEKLRSAFYRAAGKKFIKLLNTKLDEKEIPEEPKIIPKKSANSPEEEAKKIIKEKFKKLPAFISNDAKNEAINIDEKDEEGYTQLSWAAKLGDEKLVNQYLEAKADPNIANKFGMTPLLYASHYGHPGVVKRLLDAKAEEKVEDSHEHIRTALCEASIKGQGEVIDVLLNRPKAQIDQVDIDCNFLKIIGRKDEKSQLVLKKFISKGVSKSCLDRSLEEAAYAKVEPTVKLLIDAGAEVKDGHALDKALTTYGYNYPVICRLLLCEAKINNPHELLKKLSDFKPKKTKNTITAFFSGKVYTDIEAPINPFDLYICTKKLLDQQNKLRSELKIENTDQKNPLLLNDEDYKQAQELFLMIKQYHKLICDEVKKSTSLLPELLNIIDDFNHPHDHSFEHKTINHQKP